MRFLRVRECLLAYITAMLNFKGVEKLEQGRGGGKKRKLLPPPPHPPSFFCPTVYSEENPKCCCYYSLQFSSVVNGNIDINKQLLPAHKIGLSCKHVTP